MYKAIKEIGGYKIGDIVPDEKALVWLKMYAIPHVEKVEGKGKKEEEPEVAEEEEKPAKSKKKDINNILEDYLGRNTSVVKHNILEDNLSKQQLKELLELEKADKKKESYN